MISKIYETRNYDLFDECSFNRDKRGLEGLKASIRKWGQREPACVLRRANGRFSIKRGHRRFQACKEVGAPFRYYIEEKVDDIPIFETEKVTARWSLTDWMTSYARAGRPEYIALLKYHRETGIPVSQCICLLSGQATVGSNLTPAFKAGNFKVTATDLPSVVADIVETCKLVDKAIALNTRFIGGLARIARLDEFNPERFKQKVLAHPSFFKHQATQAQYMKMIEQIYNYHCGDKADLAFRADEQARRRAAE